MLETLKFKWTKYKGEGASKTLKYATECRTLRTFAIHVSMVWTVLFSRVLARSYACLFRFCSKEGEKWKLNPVKCIILLILYCTLLCYLLFTLCAGMRLMRMVSSSSCVTPSPSMMIELIRSNMCICTLWLWLLLWRKKDRNPFSVITGGIIKQTKIKTIIMIIKN